MAVDRARLRLAPEPRRFDVELLRRQYVEERVSAAEVAARLGLTVAAAQSRLRRAGVRRPPAVSSEQVGSLYEQGLSIRAIATELGIHQRDVWRELGRAGVARRPRGAPGVVLSKRSLDTPHAVVESQVRTTPFDVATMA